MSMFTRNEISQLLNIDLKNIPYLVSSLGIEPIRLGKKYSNTLYDTEQLIKMKLAVYFKEKGLSYDFTKSYIKAVERKHGCFLLEDDIWVNFRDWEAYIEDIKKLKVFTGSNKVKKWIDWQTIETSDGIGDVEIKGKSYYLVLSSSDLKELLNDLVDSCLRLDIETIRFPDKLVISSELIDNAKRNGIDVSKLEAFFNKAA